mmetsp:Transcript_15286/g.35235  ORF Transcript_15286/g.35235 Transcript_15286/m.35235 type:complete len:99 (+) Transcript_15286:1321-1617(+)
MQTPDSVPKAVAVGSSSPNSSAFLASVTPRLVKKQAGATSVTPSASRSDTTVDKLIGSRVFDSATSDEDMASLAIDAMKNNVNVWDENRIFTENSIST